MAIYDIIGNILRQKLLNYMLEIDIFISSQFLTKIMGALKADI